MTSSGISGFSVCLSGSQVTHSFLKSVCAGYFTVLEIQRVPSFPSAFCSLVLIVAHADMLHPHKRMLQPLSFWNSILSGPSTILQTLLRLLQGLPTPSLFHWNPAEFYFNQMNVFLSSMHPKCRTLEDIQRISARWRKRVMDNCWVRPTPCLAWDHEIDRKRSLLAFWLDGKCL